MTTTAPEFPARTLTFNRDDWSGKDITIEVGESNDFTFEGYRFHLVETTDPNQEDEPGQKYHCRTFDLIGDGWTDRLFCIFKFDSDERWETMHAAVSRTAADPVIAAVRVLCNTL